MRRPERPTSAGLTRISRMSVPSRWSTGKTSRHTRSCSESVTRPHPAKASDNRSATQRQRIQLRYANRLVSSRCECAPCNPPFLAAFFAQREAMSMPGNEPKRIGLSVEMKPHAYDPAREPELFEGVLARRVVAFIIDVVLIAVPLIFVALFIFVFGLVT